MTKKVYNVKKTARIWARVTPEKRDQLKEWSEQLGISLSQFIGICAWAGAKEVMRTLDHEIVIPLEDENDELPETSV